MVIGKHPDGRICLLAHEFNIMQMMVRSPEGKWHQHDLSAEELIEFEVIRNQSVAKGFVQEVLKIFLECICPAECDCANPEPEQSDAVASVSNACPEHNLYPEPVDECPAEEHKGCQSWHKT